MSHVVLYDIGCAWEIDYVTKMLLKDILDDSYVCHFFKTPELLKYNDTSAERLILVFTSNLASFTDIKTLAERVKLHVIIHLSDEWGTKPEFVELSSLANLVLRQHWFPKLYEPRSNLFPIPLGVMTNYPVLLTPKPMTQRSLVWSFIGTVNHQRQHMINTLLSELVNKPCFVRRGGVKIEDVADTYNNSIFVPNERGAVRLDCFRLYEATVAGAIPVVVGSKEELGDTFVYDYDTKEEIGLLPPWIFAQDWVEASTKCLALLENTVALQKMQTENLTWFWSRIKLAQKRIAHAVSNHVNK